MNINVKTSWKEIINKQTMLPYWDNLSVLVDKAYKENICYPDYEKIFACFNYFDFERTKVVIIGQDPYYTPNAANGLAFSVNEENKIPKSLINIFKELKNDLGVNRTKKDLSDWAQQGVLLLNNCLTVTKDKPNSHSKFGWEIFTNNIIKEIDQKLNGVIFVLWGNFANAKRSLLINPANYVLTASHPSPLSAYHGFFGCKHFSKINQILRENKLVPIKW